MSLEALVRERQAAWQKLDNIVGEVARRGVRSVEPSRLDDLIQLYRTTSADLARLRAYEADPALVRQVNRLVTRAHAIVYRAPESRWSLATFFAATYPRLFREAWPFVATSFGILTIFFVLAYVVVQGQPAIVADVLGGSRELFRETRQPGQFSQRFESLPSPVLSSFVTTNNIKVAFNAFAFGVTFGIGTVYVLIVNGTMLGGFAGTFGKSGLGAEFWMTVLPHGALELSAIVIAGASGLMIGYGMWCPGRRRRLTALKQEALRAVQLVIGLVPAFIVAGSFEGFLTPSRAVSAPVKVGIGLGATVIFWVYLSLAGRGSVTADDAA